MRVKLSQAGQIGLIEDRSDIDLPINAWTSGNNVRFEHNAVKAAFGYSGITVPLTAANLILQAEYFRVPTSQYLVYASDTDADSIADTVLYYDGTVEIALSGWTTTGATASDYVQMCVFSGNVVVSNGLNPPVSWDGSGGVMSVLTWDGVNTWADYDGAGATYAAKIIRSYRNFLIAMDIVDDGVRNPRLVHWSSLAEPGQMPPSWDFSDAAEESGRTELTDTTGYIIDGLQLRDAFVIYQEDAITLMTYTGGQFIQQIIPVTRDRGLLSTNCVKEVNGRHLCLGQKDLYWFDGRSLESAAEGRVRDTIFNSIDQEKKQFAFVAHNIADNEIWVCFPSIGATYADTAYVLNYTTNQWSKRDLPNLTCTALGSDLNEPQIDWDDETDLDWDDETILDWAGGDYAAVASILYGAGAQWYELDVTNQSDGANQTKYVQRAEINLGELDQWSMVKRIWPRAEGEAFVIKVGTQDVQEGAITWESESTFTPGTDNHIDLRVTGRYHALRVESTTNVNWSLMGLDVEYVSVGLR